MSAWVAFQSTLSVRRATAGAQAVQQSVEISIHALRKESDKGLQGLHRQDTISIHALRKESDQTLRHIEDGHMISIHALRKESDVAKSPHAVQRRFQSTLSVRRATRPADRPPSVDGISIHALRKESDWTGEHQRHDRSIASHALRKESDDGHDHAGPADFNPRSP